MTANELIDELVWIAKNRGDSISRQLADIVRQQQAEIEKLGSELDRIVELYTDKAIENEALKKELTDEEIIKVYEDMLGVASAKGSAIDFARAILKKAKEK